ncbi:hypothetical protein NDU88_002177 [Pleurodeles waltl]|uniref:Uncharacterized protein n=1 Tax=Pleurodeles waltl TaxID=8319 RepID=A0AAV7MMF0_PLEWA|nr:hypothetical protein NDU88_002177 [Pleurodeles waltl]
MICRTLLEDGMSWVCQCTSCDSPDSVPAFPPRECAEWKDGTEGHEVTLRTRYQRSPEENVRSGKKEQRDKRQVFLFWF